MPIPENLAFFLIAAVLGYFVFRFFKHGGFRGALYGSPVAKTFGDLQLARYAGATTTLRVHLLEDGRIVLEQTSRALLSVSLRGIPMGPIDADQLIKLLQRARSDV